MVAAVRLLILIQRKVKLVHLAKKSQASPHKISMFYYNSTSKQHAYYFLMCYNSIFSSEPKEIFSLNAMKNEQTKLAQKLIIL